MAPATPLHRCSQVFELGSQSADWTDWSEFRKWRKRRRRRRRNRQYSVAKLQLFTDSAQEWTKSAAAYWCRYIQSDCTRSRIILLIDSAKAWKWFHGTGTEGSVRIRRISSIWWMRIQSLIYCCSVFKRTNNEMIPFLLSFSFVLRTI